MNRRLSDLGPSELDAMTDTMTDAEISAIFGLSRTAATYARKRMGIRSHAEKTGKRHYKDAYEIKPGAKRAFSYSKSGADARYFQSIENSRQAYWLGLLLADGWIVTHKSTPTGFALALHERDMHALRSFEQELGCPGMIKRTRAGSNLYQVKLTSREAAHDLISLGIVPKKSKVARMPRLPRQLNPHLVRGYFDGDGSVSVRGNALTAQFTSGSKELLEDLGEILYYEAGIGFTIAEDRASFVMRMYAKNAIRLARYMHGSMSVSDVAFERKLKKFTDYLDSDAGRSWEQLLSDLDSAPSR